MLGGSGERRENAVPNFETFRVLLDDPAAAPALRYPEYARAFAQIIRHSDPQFAIGIFGDWGSGKTTLMRAIERELAKDRSVVTVEFNAWRYEREPDLIVPLLDRLREEFSAWRARTREERARAQRAAETVGRAAKALVAATKIKASVLGVGLELDPQAAAAAYASADAPAEPESFYHRSFKHMSDAIADFVDASDGDVRRRVVVFVDDLDRCLPNSALQVLESMKLFFDLKGFVFVVGLDRDVIERSIELKYGGGGDRRSGDGHEGPEGEAEHVGIRGADYIKKIFQVPFGLPRITAGDLRPFFDSLLANSSLPDAQRTHLDKVVWPHLAATTEGDSVNPREVKRLINAYTLQMKMLSARRQRKTPDPDVVLALQTMAFRADWERLYELLTTDPPLFIDALQPVVSDPTGTAEFALTTEPLPRSFISYVKGKAAALLETEDLGDYVAAAEATRSTDPAVLEAQNVLAQVQGLLREIGRRTFRRSEQSVVADLHDKLNILNSKLARRSTPLTTEAIARTTALVNYLKETVPSPSPDVLESRPEWVARTEPMVEALNETLRAMRRETVVGSAAA
jgi:hypothetical protein